MSKRNPTNHPQLQALIDLSDFGLGDMKVRDAVTRLSSDPTLRKDLRTKWNSHPEAERKMTFTQQSIDQRTLELSPLAHKVLTLLGMYCSKSGCIQAKISDICAVLKSSRTSTKAAITELIDCGAIVSIMPAKRHEAPVYQVNPALFIKGPRASKPKHYADFASRLDIKPDAYILAQKPSLVVKIHTVTDEKTFWNRLYLVSPEAEAEKPKARRSKKRQDDILPGQMSIVDFLEDPTES